LGGERRRGASIATVLAVAAFLAACGAIEDTDPPVRNPVADASGGTAWATPAEAAATPPLHTGAAPVGIVAAGSAAEIAAGRAIEAMAGWLGAPQRELTPRLVEAVDWPSACLGVQQPLLCAQVTTPGYRMRIEDALGATHAVHVEAMSGRALWAGEVLADAIVTSVDAAARRVIVRAGGQTLTLRIAPGTTWFPEDGEGRATGKRVRVAYDPAVAPGTAGTAAWVALEGS